MNDNMIVWNILKSVPAAAKKKILGGRLKGMTDIKPQWRLQMMTEQFGPIGKGWYYDIVDRWTETAANEISCFVSVKLYIKDDDKWSAPIAGIGGSMLLAMENIKDYESKNAEEKYGSKFFKPYHSDEAYKMATTDALSVAMKQLGVAADVYMGLSDSKYDKPANDTHKAPERPAQKFEEYKPATANQREAFKQFMSEFVKTSDTAAIKHLSEHMDNSKLSESKASELITSMTDYLKNKDTK